MHKKLERSILIQCANCMNTVHFFFYFLQIVFYIGLLISFYGTHTDTHTYTYTHQHQKGSGFFFACCFFPFLKDIERSREDFPLLKDNSNQLLVKQMFISRGVSLPISRRVSTLPPPSKSTTSPLQGVNFPTELKKASFLFSFFFGCIFYLN